MTIDPAIAKALAVPASKIIHEVYGDLFKPGVRQVGKALDTVLGLGNTILLPVAWGNERVRIASNANLERYRRKMEDIPEDGVCPVPPEVGVPILEKLSYVTNEQLSEMYIELLAKASQKESANVAHPSFVNIINNISPDEAIFMRSIRYTDFIPYVEVREITSDEKHSWITVDPIVLSPTFLSELTYPNNGAAYVSNLLGLGIFAITPGDQLTSENAYKDVEEYAQEKLPVRASIKQGKKIIHERGVIRVTAFAKLFLGLS